MRDEEPVAPVNAIEINLSNHTEGGSEMVGGGWGLTPTGASTAHGTDLFSETMHG